MKRTSIQVSGNLTTVAWKVYKSKYRQCWYQCLYWYWDDTLVSVPLLYIMLRLHRRGDPAVCVAAAALTCHSKTFLFSTENVIHCIWWRHLSKMCCRIQHRRQYKVKVMIQRLFRGWGEDDFKMYWLKSVKSWLHIKSRKLECKYCTFLNTIYFKACLT